MNSITVFRFEEIADVRTITDEKGDPWFFAVDVCAALGIANSRDALQKLDDDEKGVASTDTLGGVQELGIISESGLYTLILRCRDAVNPGTLPHRFRRWVTSEVLPSIRKTGGYQITSTRALLAVVQRMVDVEDEQLRLAREHKELATQVVYISDKVAGLYRTVGETHAQMAALVNGEDYFTVVGFANLMGVRLDKDRTAELGKRATRVCKERGFETGKATHPVYGKVNTYPREVLEAVFSN